MPASTGLARQDNKYLKTGKQKVFVRRRLANGSFAYKDVGNLESANVALETEDTNYTTNEDDLGVPVKTKKTITSATLNMVARNHNPIVTMLALLSEPYVYTQAAAQGVAYTAEGPFENGDVIVLEKNKISNVEVAVAGAGGAELSAADFAYDATAGMIKILNLPDDYDDEDLVVTFDQAAFTTKMYGGFSVPGGFECEIVMRDTSTDGPQNLYRFHKVIVSPDGEQGLVADGNDPLTRTFACAILQDETQTDVNFGFYTVREIQPAA